jgi:hypothetical protein
MERGMEGCAIVLTPTLIAIWRACYTGQPTRPPFTIFGGSGGMGSAVRLSAARLPTPPPNGVAECPYSIESPL